MVRVEIALESHIAREHVRLDIPPDWIPLDSKMDLVAELNRYHVELTVVVQLARTQISVGEWSRSRPGDAVVFDDCVSPSGADAWPVVVRCGTFRARGELASDGVTVLQTQLTPPDRDDAAASDVVVTHAADIGRNVMSAQPPSADSLAVLASAPIEIVAELGRFAVRADELVVIGPGAVLPFGAPRSTAVELRIGERTWARGELVDVDGRLGVRLTSIVRSISGAVDSEEADTER